MQSLQNILYHPHTCYSTDAWAPHQTEDYPCTCGLNENVKQYFLNLIDSATLLSKEAEDELHKMVEEL